MSPRAILAGSIVLVTMSLGACRLLGPGYQGPIQPPALDVPVPVSDLRAIQYGDQIIAGFSISRLTTEGQPLKSLRSVDLYAGPGGPAADDPNSWSRTATHYLVPPPAGSTTLIPGTYEYRLSAQAVLGNQSGKDLILRVRSTGPKGKLSLWSLPASLGVITPIARPTALMAESLKAGVRLTWQGSGPHYRILRSIGSEMPQSIGTVDKPEYLDDSAQFGMPYQYFVLAYTDDLHQSAISDPLAQPITTVDIFPPEVPAGLTAVVGVNAIELQWDLNTEADFKGYNVFRSVDGGAFERVASLIAAATYHDPDVQPGKTYRYQVSAVDLLGNESKRSDPVSIALP